MKKNNKGFTLAEMLIVVAIIGILIAILFPTFTAQISKTKQARNTANVRSKLSEVAADALLNKTTKSDTVDISDGGAIDSVIGGVTVSGTGTSTATVSCGDDGSCSITLS